MVALPVVRAIVTSLKEGGAPVVTPVILSNRLGVIRSPVLGLLSCAKRKRPTRTSQTTLDRDVCVKWPNVMAGTEVLLRIVASNGVTAVGGSGLTQCS